MSNPKRDTRIDLLIALLKAEEHCLFRENKNSATGQQLAHARLLLERKRRGIKG